MFETSVDGTGLHSGRPVRVVLRARAGAVTLSAAGLEARVDELWIAATARATTVEAHGGALRLGTVEHLLAALAGLGVYDGVELRVEGPELPLLDGGAAVWCQAIERLGLARTPPRIRVARAAVIDVGPSRYEFTPGAGVELEVRLVVDRLDEATVMRDARWAGDTADFCNRIAPARTFVFARDIEDLVAQGLARHVDPASVVVIGPRVAQHSGRAFAPDEPARHKLLDLMGDLYLYGGPPRGLVRATRPGHAANAKAMTTARAQGVIVPI